MKYNEATLLAPVQPGERIQSMDVLRGLALLGIGLMNIESFNRTSYEVFGGLATGEGPAAYAASWFIWTFITSKFWPMFSLLFGMGFAVMLLRAQALGRPFLGVYLRRTAALAVLGALHGTLIWTGDILFSYAITAFGLLLAWYGRWWYWAVLMAVSLAAIILLKMNSVQPFLVVLVLSAVFALYLRDEGTVRGRPRPLVLFAVAAFGLGAAATVMVVMGKYETAVGLGTLGVAMTVFYRLGRRYRERVADRPMHIFVGILLLMTMMNAAWSILDHVSAQAKPVPAQVTATVASSTTATATKAKTQAEKDIEEMRKYRAERKAKSEAEKRVMHGDSYLATVRYRMKEFLFNILSESGTAISALPIFLLGGWLVSRGMMSNPSAHARSWRRIAFWGLLIGGGLSVMSSLISTARIEGDTPDIRFQLAFSLHMLGSEPLMLGYVAAIVLALQTRAGQWLTCIVPAGRMALTNYLSQSLIYAFIFYGWGLGLWGIPRHQQAAVVLTVWVAQVCISTLWLQHFRYGPIEWLWRWATYGRRPALRYSGADLDHAGAALKLGA